MKLLRGGGEDEKLESERMWGSLIGFFRRGGGCGWWRWWWEEVVDEGGDGGGREEGDADGDVMGSFVGGMNAGGLTVEAAAAAGVRRRTAGVWCETDSGSPEAKATRAEPVKRSDRQ